MKNFSSLLNAWYRKEARDLPWRQTTDPYKIWISEIMLQQTTVAAVIPYYERWIKTFPTVSHVSKSRLQTILKSWQGLGYYSRARNIHKSAKILHASFNAQIPQTPEELKQLPGFGPYTIGAVLSIAFDKRHPIIDANVRRVFMRILAIEGFATTEHDPKIYVLLDKVMPQKDLRTFNQALMELGALICRSKEPLCNLCPVRVYCKAYEKGIQEIIPTPKISKITNIEAVIAIIKKGDQFLIQQRKSKGLLADLWEFPGGKIEKGETPVAALKREIKEELNVKMTKAELLLKLKHYYTQFCVHLNVFKAHVTNDPSADSSRKWVTLPQMTKYPMPSGSSRIVEYLNKQQKKVEIN